MIRLLMLKLTFAVAYGCATGGYNGNCAALAGIERHDCLLSFRYSRANLWVDRGRNK